MHSQYLALSKAVMVEPRIGAKYKIADNQSIALAYGLHSQRLSMRVYFDQLKEHTENGVIYTTPNEGLDFAKAHHLVLGYDWNFGQSMRLKAEVYYQSIFDAVVETELSSYSLLNRGSFDHSSAADNLKNGGIGYNYGIELTIERFLHKGLYFLSTTSLYESKYEGSDGVERNTAFNGKYVVNALIGKEWILNSKNENAKTKKILFADAKVTVAGGRRYTPVDFEASQQNMTTEYVENEAYTKQFNEYFRADIRFGIRIDGKKMSQEFAFDIQNLTNHENPLYNTYNLETQEEKTVFQLGIFPMMQYRIVF